MLKWDVSNTVKYEKIFHILTRQYTNVNYLSDTENSLSNTLNAVHVCDLSHTNLSFRTREELSAFKETSIDTNAYNIT